MVVCLPLPLPKGIYRTENKMSIARGQNPKAAVPPSYTYMNSQFRTIGPVFGEVNR